MIDFLKTYAPVFAEVITEALTISAIGGYIAIIYILIDNYICERRRNEKEKERMSEHTGEQAEG